MGLPKVFGVIFILASVIWGTILGFTYISHSFNNATGGRHSLGELGLLIPLMICGFFFIFGNILVRDRVLDSHH